MGSGTLRQRLAVGKAHRAVRPTTRLGRWAAWLAACSVVLILAWRVMGPAGAAPGFAFGLAGGVVALVAILRRGERAIAVFAALVPLVFVLVFLVAELISLVIGSD